MRGRGGGRHPGSGHRLVVRRVSIGFTTSYLKNLIEQDHQAIKSRGAPMLGFKSRGTAAITLSGIELAHRIRNGQLPLAIREFSLANPADRGATSLKRLCDRAPSEADAITKLRWSE